jgi:hypothetical protein
MLVDRCPWYVAGSILGALIIALRATVNRPLKAVGARSLVSGEPIAWNIERPRKGHIGGSVLFALGWTVAATCPGPVAAMVVKAY